MYKWVGQRTIKLKLENVSQRRSNYSRLKSQIILENR